MSGTLSAVVTSVSVSGLNYTIVAVVALIAVAALGVAWVLAREVLAASEGTENMQRIAGAVQEGAAAYLSRQFRTLIPFAVIIFFGVALVIINNAMVMATLQRVKEIGTMRAIGAQRRFVLVLVVVERAAYLDRYAAPDKGWTDRDESRWPVPYWHIDTGMAALLILLTATDEDGNRTQFTRNARGQVLSSERAISGSVSPITS